MHSDLCQGNIPSQLCPDDQDQDGPFDPCHHTHAHIDYIDHIDHIVSRKSRPHKPDESPPERSGTKLTQSECDSSKDEKRQSESTVDCECPKRKEHCRECRISGGGLVNLRTLSKCGDKFCWPWSELVEVLKGVRTFDLMCLWRLWVLVAVLLDRVELSEEQSTYFSPQGSLMMGSEESWDTPFRSGSSTYGNGFTCLNIPVNFTLCRNIGYSKMMIPNLLGHDSLQESEYHAKSWVPLLGLQCHPDTQLFLCSLFSPICLDRPIYPCRSLCQGVQSKCEPRMLAYNYPWPSMLKCDQFPEDHDLCIKPGAANNSDKTDDPDCPSCNQAHTCENIVDHFCRADFVFRAKFKRSRGSSLEFRRGKWFKPREGRKAREFRDLTLDHKDNCCSTKLRAGHPYIVMGVKRGDQNVATFVMQWNGNDKVLKNAIRTFRSMDCSNPLPMSIGTEDGARNGTAGGGGGRRKRRRQGGHGQRARQQQYGGCRVSSPGTNQ